MSQQLLGFRKNGQPIYPIKPGMIATACVISCSQCRTIIRGMGGPIHDAYCIPCFEAKENASSDPSNPERT